MKNIFILICLVSLAFPTVSFSQTAKKTLLTEEDGFKWYRLEQDGYMGAESEFGKTIIPLSNRFDYVQVYRGLFHVTKKYFGEGLYDLNGEELFSTSNGYSFDLSRFKDLDEVLGNTKYCILQKDNKEGLLDVSGKIILPCIYDFIHYSKVKGNRGYFKVEREKNMELMIYMERN